MSLTYAGLCEGYGGLTEGIASVLGGELAWYSEYDAAPSKILAHRYPGVPNLGDMTRIDWAAAPKVDVLTGGTPCQDLSHAGKRAGMTDGTRSNLWVQMREAINAIRPRLVVWENVRGALSAHADSDLEPCPGCVGDADDGTVLRALGRVLGDLAELGYDAFWYGLRAADAGAAHGRFRVFVFATPTDADRSGFADQARATSSERRRHVEQGASGPDLGECRSDLVGNLVGGILAGVDVDQVAKLGDRLGTQCDRVHAQTIPPISQAGLTLLPTPVADNSRGLPSKGTDYQSLPNAVTALLPTPAVNDMGAGKTVEAWDAWTDRMKREHGNGNGHGASLSIEAQRLALLPTPSVADTTGGRKARSGARSDELLLNGIAAADAWGQYAAAINRWAAVMGRPAPTPTEPGPKDGRRLSAEFVEWLMGLEPGHVTDPAIGISRNAQLKALGNGVVPQQAAMACRMWLRDSALLAPKRQRSEGNSPA